MDQTHPRHVRDCLARYFAWGADPTVDAYVALFSVDATLLDVGTDDPISGGAIRDAITQVLSALPDFRLRPTAVAAAPPHVFVEAVNEATVGEVPLRWPAMYCLTVTDRGEISSGRRYYDRAALVAPLVPGHRHPFAADRPIGRPSRVDGGADCPGDPGRPGPPLGALDVSRRADAWCDGNIGALCRGHVWSGLSAPALVDRATARPEVESYLASFIARTRLKVRAATVARTRSSTFIEWVGTSVEDAARRVAFVEVLATDTGDRRDWRLYFDTASVAPDGARAGLIGELYAG